MRSETISQNQKSIVGVCLSCNSNKTCNFSNATNNKLQNNRLNSSNEEINLKNSRSSSLPLKIMFKQQASRSNNRISDIAQSWNGSSNLTFQAKQAQQQQQQLPRYHINHYFANSNSFNFYKYPQLSLSEYFLNILEQQQKKEINEMRRVLLEKPNGINSLNSSYSSTGEVLSAKDEEFGVSVEQQANETDETCSINADFKEETKEKDEVEEVEVTACENDKIEHDAEIFPSDAIRFYCENSE